MTRRVTRQEFLRTAGKLAAVVASGSALAAIDGTVLAAGDDDPPPSPFSPRPGARRVCADAVLSIAFDQPPTVGAAGLVRVVRASEGAGVDTTDLAATAQTRTIGLTPAPFHSPPVLVSGSTASI